MNVEDVFSKNILNKYEIKEYNHALAILKMDYPNELNELKYVLENVHLNINDVLAAGGSKSPVVKNMKPFFTLLGGVKYKFVVIWIFSLFQERIRKIQKILLFLIM